jgi:hypothetical protein
MQSETKIPEDLRERYEMAQKNIRSGSGVCAISSKFIVHAIERIAALEARTDPAREGLVIALQELCDSLRRREGSKLIHVNHDELMELIPKARAALRAAGAEA